MPFSLKEGYIFDGLNESHLFICNLLLLTHGLFFGRHACLLRFLASNFEQTQKVTEVDDVIELAFQSPSLLKIFPEYQHTSVERWEMKQLWTILRY